MSWDQREEKSQKVSVLENLQGPIPSVTGQCLFNVPDVTLVPNFGRILVASLSNVNVASCYGAIIGILWIIGCSLQGTVLNMVSSVFDVVNYNSDNVL